MIIDFAAERKKRARARRQRQNKTRRRAWTGLRIKGFDAVKLLSESERKWRQFTKEHPMRWKPTSTPISRPGVVYRNEGKKAVRRDRALRKQKQREEKKLIAALRARVLAREQEVQLKIAMAA